MKQKICLLSERPEDHAFAEGVAEAMQGEIVFAIDPIDAIRQASLPHPAVVLADMSSESMFQNFEDSMTAFRPAGATLVPSNYLHAISPNDASTWSRMNSASSFGHLIVRMFEDPKREGFQYGQMLTHSRMAEKTGLSALLRTDAEITVVTMTKSQDRKTVLEMAEEFLNTKTEFSPRVAQVVLNAVDELLMNAIFDAPTTDLGEQQLSNTPRTSEMDLVLGREVEIQIGKDDEYVGFTTTDRFGSLAKEKLFSCIFRDTQKLGYEVDMTKANAGLGLSLIFRSGGSLLFVTKPGERTDVTVLFKRDSTSFRALREQFRYVAVQTV